MDPVSLLASALTFISAIVATYETINKITGLPKAFDEVRKDLPLVQRILKDAHASIRESKPPTEEYDEILEIVRPCNLKVKELSRIFDEVQEKCKGDQDAKDWAKVSAIYHKALRGIKAHRVETLMDEILKGVKRLALSQVFKTAMQKDLKAIEKAIEELSKVEPSLADSDFDAPGTIYASQAIATGATAHQYNLQGGVNTINSGNTGGSGPNYFGGTNTVDECIQAFRTTNYEGQKDLNPKRENETCLWCLEDKRFLNWRDKHTSCLLWVTADPGCGKSVLSRALVDERLLDSTPNDTTICYFFFKDISEEQRSPVCAVAALLHQLLCSSIQKKVIGHFLEVFKTEKEKISQNLEVMWRIVRAIAQDSDCGKIVFLLDALDECQLEEQEGFITRLKELEQTQSHLRSANNFRIFITSRPYWDIEQKFKTLISDIPGIRLKGESQSESLRSEIDRVINARVSRLDDDLFTGPRARKQLLKGLLGVENRTYLWLHLVLSIIESKSRIGTETVKGALQTIPDTLEKTYDAILTKSVDVPLAKRLLNIVIGAVRPLSLSEIDIALYITEESHSYSNLELQEGVQLEISIRGLCGLFVSIVDKRVFLIHQTAKEYLIAPNNLSSSSPSAIWKHSLSIQGSNLILAHVCIWYLRLCEFGRKSSSRSEREIDGVGSKYDFLVYSAWSWPIHFRAAKIPRGHVLVESALDLCSFQDDRPMDWELVIFAPKFNTLHLASFYGLEAVVAHILATSNVDVNVADAYGYTPLWLAANKGHEAAVVELLASPGIDVNKADLKGESPLCTAAYWGRDGVVGKLLAAPGIHLNEASEFNEGSALLYAAAQGHAAVVRKLLAAPGININMPIGSVESYLKSTPIGWPLWWTTDCFNVWLITDGFSSSVFKNTRVTPLWLAAESGHKEVVGQLLAAPNIDINAVNRSRETPLHAAVRQLQEDVVYMLLAAPRIDVNALSHGGATPLSYAAERGFVMIVANLLAAPWINVNAMGYYRRTPLWLAAAKGHVMVVDQLLAVPKIDINARDFEGTSPLSVAIAREHKWVVKRLLAVPGIVVSSKLKKLLIEKEEELELDLSVGSHLYKTIFST